MNHGKHETGQRGDGRYHRQDEAPSRLDRQAERERGRQQEPRNPHEARPEDKPLDERSGLTGSVVGNEPAGQASSARGTGSTVSPRASARNTEAGHAARPGSEHEPGRTGAGTDRRAVPASTGDRDKREEQLSEPGAGFADSERIPRAGLRNTEGSADESDLATRDEGGSRDPEDVARTGLDEQKERLGMAAPRAQRRRQEQENAGGHDYGGGGPAPKDGQAGSDRRDRGARRR